MLSNNTWKIFLCAAACGMALTGSRVAYGALPAQASLLTASPSHAAIAGQGQGEQESQEPPFELLPVSPGIVKEFIHPDESDSTIEFEFSPDGSKIIAGTHPGNDLVVWDVQSGAVETRISSQPSRHVNAKYFHVSSDWATVYVARYFRTREQIEENGQPKTRYKFEGGVDAYDLQTGELKHTFQHDPPRGNENLRLTPDGRFLVTQEYLEGDVYWEYNVGIWDVASGEYRESPNALNQFRGITQDGDLVLSRSAAEDATKLQTQFLKPDDFRVRLSISHSTRETISSEFSPDGKLMVGYDYRKLTREPPLHLSDFEIVFRDVATGRELLRHQMGSAQGYNMSPHSFSRDSKWMATAATDQEKINLLLFRARDQSLRHSIRLEESTPQIESHPQKPAFSADGKWAVVCVNRYPRRFVDVYDPKLYPQPRIYIINVETGEIAKTLIARQGWVNDPQFSLDGKFFAVSEFRKVTLWDWEEMIEGLE